MPVHVAAAGENDFTAVLSVSATEVTPPNTVVWTYITITNTDPTYGCDVSVSTPGGLSITTFYLESGASRVVNHVEDVTETRDIYYVVTAYHGPDISKTKNTNTVRVTYDDGTSSGSGTTDVTPVEEIMGEVPEVEYEPIEGIPTSGSIYMAEIENVVYDGYPVDERPLYMASTFTSPKVMSADVTCHLPDSIAADYLDRAEEDRVQLYVRWGIAGASSAGLDEILEAFTVTEDDQLIELEQTLSFHDIPEFHDEIPDHVILTVNLYDPLGGASFYDYVSVGIYNVSDMSGSYTISMGDTYVNGHLVDPTESIDLLHGEDFVIEQYVHYTVPSYDLELEDWRRAIIYTNCHVDGNPPFHLGAPEVEAEVAATSGDMLFTITADSTSFVPWGLDLGMHTFEIYGVQRRDTLVPYIDNSDTLTLNINLVDELEEEPETDEDTGTTLFDGLMFGGSIFEWLGFIDGEIDLIPDDLELAISSEGYVDLEGTIDFTCYEEDFYIRLSGGEAFGEPLATVPETPSCEMRYSRRISIIEATELNLTAEIYGSDGVLIATDTETINITGMGPVSWGDYRQRYSLSAAPMIIGYGESTNIYFSLSNEFTGDSVHLRLIDESDGSIVCEDSNFENFEEAIGSIPVSPIIPTRYFYTAQVLDDDGTILWHQTKDVYIVVMPNPAEDDGEETVFNLNLGASATTIAPGEEVRIYGAIDYGSFGEAVGEISVNIIDQDHHTLYFDASCMPHDTIAFAETYILDATTTFAITANGFEVAGDAVYADTDTITITVEEPAADIADDDPVYDMDFRVEATETVIAPGESVDITATLLNMGTEDVSAVVFEEDSSFFGDVVRWLHEDDALVASETMTFDETTTISLRACAWAEGDMLIFTETIDITIVVDAARTVDPTMPADDPGIDEAVDIDLYNIDFSVTAREMTIREGESTDIYIDCMNTGTLAVDIIIAEPGGAVMFTGEDIEEGSRFDNVIHWAPEETSTKFIGVQALDEFGVLVYSEVKAVTVTITPEAAEPESAIDLEVAVSDTEIILGDLVDMDIDVTNTGDVAVSEFIVSETLEGSSAYGDDLSPGDSRHLDVNNWEFTRTTTVIFILTGYDETGRLIASDTESITVTVNEPPLEEPVEEPPLADEPDESDEEPMFEPAPRDDTSDSGDASLSDTEDRTTDSGVNLSLEPVSHSEMPADGEITLVKSNQEEFDYMAKIYNLRRLFVVLIILVLILIIILLISLVGRKKRKQKKSNTANDEDF